MLVDFRIHSMFVGPDAGQAPVRPALADPTCRAGGENLGDFVPLDL